MVWFYVFRFIFRLIFGGLYDIPEQYVSKLYDQYKVSENVFILQTAQEGLLLLKYVEEKRQESRNNILWCRINYSTALSRPSYLEKKYYNDLRAKCVRSQANTIICTHRKHKQIKNGSAFSAPLSRFFTHFDCICKIKSQGRKKKGHKWKSKEKEVKMIKSNLRNLVKALFGSKYYVQSFKAKNRVF